MNVDDYVIENLNAFNTMISQLSIDIKISNEDKFISVGPRPSFGEPWSCLTIFGTSTGWSKMKFPGKEKIT
jgi:hypothetical protein